MNAPGWQPDPTTRHEYRYWDGSQWTDDVSDGGVTSVDPVDGSGAAAAGGFAGDATSQMGPATQAYGSSVGAPPPGGPQGPGSYGSYGGYGADPYAPSYGGSSGGMPPGPAPKKGPNPALIVAIVAVVILALGGGAFALMSGGDDDDDPQAGTTTTTSAPDSTTTTAPPDDTTTTTEDDTTDTTADDSGGTANDDTIVPLIAEGIQESAPELTDEQAECIAQVIVDEVGVEELMRMGIEGNPDNAFDELTTEQQASLATAMLDCAPADVLAGAGGGA